MENDLPKIDLPEDWVIGTDITEELLSHYTNFPCRMKAELFVLCMEGEIEVSINLSLIRIEPYSFTTLLPDSIFQIHSIKGNLKIYFMGFASHFISRANLEKSALETIYKIRETPTVCIQAKVARIVEGYYTALLQTYAQYNARVTTEMLNLLLAAVFKGIGAMYRDKVISQAPVSRAEQIGKDFRQLVIQHYTTQRSVAWYAKQLGITPAHLSTVVKQVSGKTCNEIIMLMVIMDAKTQLRTTTLSVHEIAYSLNFTNMSFFGKYFKRYVGVGPLEYRNNR